MVGVEWSAVATVRSGRRTPEPAGAQAGEGLRAGDLVDEVEVDREDGGRALVLGDDVVVPDLLDEGARARCGRSGAGIGHGAAAPGAGGRSEAEG